MDSIKMALEEKPVPLPYIFLNSGNPALQRVMQAQIPAPVNILPADTKSTKPLAGENASSTQVSISGVSPHKQLRPLKPSFTSSEIEVLLEQVQKNKDDVWDQADSQDWLKNRTSVWNHVTQMVNAVAPKGIVRAKKEVRDKFYTLCAAARKITLADEPETETGSGKDSKQRFYAKRLIAMGLLNRAPQSQTAEQSQSKSVEAVQQTEPPNKENEMPTGLVLHHLKIIAHSCQKLNRLGLKTGAFVVEEGSVLTCGSRILTDILQLPQAVGLLNEHSTTVENDPVAKDQERNGWEVIRLTTPSDKWVKIENGETPESDDKQVSENGRKFSFKCPLCDAKFSTLSAFVTHSLHHKDASSDEASGQNAKEKVGMDCDMFACRYCEKKFQSLSKWLTHERTHADKMPFKCDVCDYRTKYRSWFSRHTKGHGLSVKNALKEHLAVRGVLKNAAQTPQQDEKSASGPEHCAAETGRGENSPDSSFVVKTEAVSGTSEDVSQFSEDVSRSSAQEGDLLTPKAEAEEDGSVGQTAEQSQSEPRDKTGQTPTHTFACGYCGKTFYKKMRVIEHERLHTGEKPHKCDFCDFRTSHRGRFRKHRLKFHRDLYLQAKQAKKSAEEKKERQKQNLPNVCSYCGKKFSYPCILTEHERIHTGEKPFQCDTCGYRTGRRACLRQHMRRHRKAEQEGDPTSSTTEEPVASDQDGGKSIPSSQTKPPRSTRFPCRYCGKYMKSGYYLREHERTHMGLRIYKCDLCDYRFCHSGSLRGHIHRHHRPGIQRIIKKRGQRLPNILPGVAPEDQSSTESRGIAPGDLSQSSTQWGDLLRPTALEVPGSVERTARHPPVKQEVESVAETEDVSQSSVQEGGVTSSPKVQPPASDQDAAQSAEGSQTDHGLPSTYACRHCGKTFSSRLSVIEHERIHSGEKPLRCDYCEYRSSHSGSLRYHLLKHHKELYLQARQAKQAEKGTPVKQKEKSDDSEDVSQSSAQEDLTSEIKVEPPASDQDAVQSAQGNQPVQGAPRHFVCRYCGRTFEKNRRLVEHERLHTGEKPLKCDFCEYRASHGAALRNHKSTYHQELYSQEKEARKAQRLQEMKDSPLVYPCSYCGKILKTKKRLIEHERLHTGERPVKCDLCEFSARYDKELRVHKSKVHNPVPPEQLKRFKCELCGIAFRLNCFLQRHMSTTHATSRPYACDQCDKRFTTQRYLDKHMERHKGLKLYQCQVCGVRLRYKVSLAQHMSRHTGEKRFSCDTCGQKFAYHHSLKLHKMTHTGERPHLCRFCGKTYKTRQHLNNHMTSHTGVKPHTCKICGQKFQRYISGAHRRKHKREKLKKTQEALNEVPAACDGVQESSNGTGDNSAEAQTAVAKLEEPQDEQDVVYLVYA